MSWNQKAETQKAYRLNKRLQALNDKLNAMRSKPFPRYNFIPPWNKTAFAMRRTLSIEVGLWILFPARLVFMPTMPCCHRAGIYEQLLLLWTESEMVGLCQALCQSSVTYFLYGRMLRTQARVVQPQYNYSAAVCCGVCIFGSSRNVRLMGGKVIIAGLNL